METPISATLTPAGHRSKRKLQRFDPLQKDQKRKNYRELLEEISSPLVAATAGGVKDILILPLVEMSGHGHSAHGLREPLKIGLIHAEWKNNR
jgi:hypothetical protein